MKTTLAILISTFCVLTTFGQQWSWSEDELSYARVSLSGAVLDDSIFFSGGGLGWGNTYSNVVDIYDVGEDVWSEVSLASTARWGAVAITAGDKVFFAGGNNYPSSGGVAVVDIYDKATNSWTVETLSLGRSLFGGAVACENKVFFAGGLILINNATAVEYTNIIDIYDIETGMWSVDSLSIPRGLIGAATVGTKVYFAGGATGNQQATDVIDIYDVSTGEWSVKYLSEPRAAVAAVSFDNEIYFAGGCRPNGSSCTVIDVFDAENGGWIDPLYFTSPRILRAFRVDDALVFAGNCNTITLLGAIFIGAANGAIDVYHPKTGQWDNTVSPLSPARVFYGDAVYKNKVYFAGGSPNPGGPPIADIDILEYESHCLPDGIEFSSQEDIDNFYADHPGCYDIEGDVIINGNDISNLNGLDLITSIGGNLSIMSNDILSSLTGLQSLSSIGGNLEIIGNFNLISLEGLGSIEANSIAELSIIGNPSLTECDVWSICQYLSTSGATATIHTNGTGCESQQAVEDACLTDVTDIGFDGLFKIAPNPVSSTAVIEYSLPLNSILSIKVLDLNGQEVLSMEINDQDKKQIILNTRGLSAGVYFCILKTSEGIHTRKMIKL